MVSTIDAPLLLVGDIICSVCLYSAWIILTRKFFDSLNEVMVCLKVLLLVALMDSRKIKGG